MRGKHGTYGRKRQQRRITPADAGKTSPRKREHVQTQDHPRGCGENTGLQARRRQLPGSPPRMRGKLTRNALTCSGVRITPADAGKTLLGILLGVRARDHPRGCGENPMTKRAYRRTPGSPPRMRGKLCCSMSPTKDNGITPADAGKTTFG